MGKSNNQNNPETVKEKQTDAKTKHITIDTPCSASDMERFLHIVSHEGHQHDAQVRGEDGRIVIEFTVD